MMTTNRRDLLLSARALAYTGAAAALFRAAPAALAAETFEVTKTEEEWKKLLKPEAFEVLRKHNTERPNTSALLHEARKGTFNCGGCDLPLYGSATKFDSGTGWPSFFDYLPDAIKTSTDYYLILPRTEVHCRRCGGHLGHRFNDGPQPTGLRYCMNGVAMTFKPADGSGA
jgi:peptide-methionine (R)-S-oxide reductase